MMKREKLDYSGASTIGRSLSAMGALIPSIESIPMDKSFQITALLDEIFIGSTPILIMVEPKSTAILNIQLAEDRSAKTWSKHINYLTSNRDIEINNTVSDQGTGLLTGIKDSLIGVHRQPDTFHALSHRLGDFVRIFRAKAYGSIASEYEREEVCLSRISQKVFDEKAKLYDEACVKTIEAIELYENFSYLYKYAIKQLNPFHSNGEIRDANWARGEIETAIELMELLEHTKVNKEVKSIKKILPDLLDYFEQTKEAIKVCKALGVSNDAIKNLSLEWQWNKAVIKAKKSDRKRRAKEKRAIYAENSKQILGDTYEDIKEKVFNELDNIIQASSIVENINSILRPYLDRARNQVTPEFLNLFAFYHNHRRYVQGKRKGKTPMEILTHKKQDKDWIELLTEAIESKNKDFFL
ncbi:MAG: hypothetical protein Q9M36_04755 [Sulfurovum sp.]|nr:hypothetical protein [Sulfurovum sp.]